MKLVELLSQRRMVRSYHGEPLDPGELDEALRTALRTPSAGNAQGVSLVVVTDAVRRRAIAEAAGEPGWVARGYPAWLSTAPVHVILCAEPEVYRQRYAEADKSSAHDPNAWPVPYWFVDAGCVFMTLLLAAAERGWAAGFQGIHNFRGLPALLHLPEDVQPLGVVTLGYASDAKPGASARRPRRPDRIHWQQW